MALLKFPTLADTYLLDVGVGTFARMEKLLRTLLKLASTCRKDMDIKR